MVIDVVAGHTALASCPVRSCSHACRPIHPKSASFQDDNNVLALGRSIGVVNIFSVRTMKQPTCSLNLGTTLQKIMSCCLPAQASLSERPAAIASIAFAPDQHIVVTDHEGRIFFASWKESAPRQLSEYFSLPNHTSTPVYAVLNKARDVAVLYSATKVNSLTVQHMHNINTLCVQIGLYHFPTKTWRAVLSIPDGKQISAVAYAVIVT